MLQRAVCAARISAAAGPAGVAGIPSALLLSRALAPSAIPLVSLGCNAQAVRWANSKAGGSTKNGRDSNPKFLGVKMFGGHWVEPGNIIIRQRGSKYGIVDSTQTVAFGKDWTIYALKPGYVKFWYHAMKRKYFVEVVKSSPHEKDFIEKYPIVRVKPYELPSLLKIPADTPVSDEIIEQLKEYVRTIHPVKLRSVLPPDTPVVGDIQSYFWNVDGSLNVEAMMGPTPLVRSPSGGARPLPRGMKEPPKPRHPASKRSKTRDAAAAKAAVMAETTAPSATSTAVDAAVAAQGAAAASAATSAAPLQ